MLLLGGGGLLLAAGTAALLGRVADLDDVGDAFRRAELRWLPLCVAGQIVAFSGFGLAFRGFARFDGGPTFPPWHLARVVGVSFAGYVLGSTAGGAAAEVWALRRAGLSLDKGLRCVLAVRTFEWGVLGSVAAIAGAATLLGLGSGAPFAMAATWLAVVPVAIVAGLLVGSPRLLGRLAPPREPPRASDVRRGARAWASWGLAQIRRGFADAVGALVVIRHVARRPHRYADAHAGVAAYWAGHLVTLYAAVRAFTESELALAALVLAFATGFAATALPLPVGGAGGVEAALATSLAAVGVPLASAVLAVVLYRLVSFWLPIVPAVIFAMLARDLQDDLGRLRVTRSR